MEEGDAVIIPPNVHFEGEGRTADAAIWVLHYQGRPHGVGRLVEPRRKPVWMRRAVKTVFLRAVVSEIAAVRLREGLTPYLTALSSALLARLATPESDAVSADGWAKRLLPEAQTEKTGLRVDQFARSAGLSSSHYRSRFRVAFGENPRAFLKNLRIKKAQDLLVETRLPIKKIAEQTGYGDVVAFHRAFRAVTGLTPGRYRREAPRAA